MCSAKLSLLFGGVVYSRLDFRLGSRPWSLQSDWLIMEAACYVARMHSFVFFYGLGPQNVPKSLAAGAPPQTSLRSLERSPNPQAGYKGPASKGPTSEGRGGKRRGWRGRERRRQNDLCPRASAESLTPPLPYSQCFACCSI